MRRRDADGPAPDRRRVDHDGMFASWGVEDRDDTFEILARSGGIQMTDCLELAEDRAPDDPMTTPLEFRVARPTRSLDIGDAAGVRRDPANLYDAFAIHVVDSAGSPVGFVPRHYSQLVARLLDSGWCSPARSSGSSRSPKASGSPDCSADMSEAEHSATDRPPRPGLQRGRRRSG